MPIYQVLIDEKLKSVEITKRTDNSFHVKIDGTEMDVALSDSKLQGDIFLGLNMNGNSHRIEVHSFEQDRPLNLIVDSVVFGAEIKSPFPSQESGSFQIPSAIIPSVQRRSSLKQLPHGTVVAPMTGKVVSIKAKIGDRVKANQVLCIIEAMKMENEITTSAEGTVQEVNVTEGSSVNEGDVLLTIA